jgi:hypothetical protein
LAKSRNVGIGPLIGLKLVPVFYGPVKKSLVYNLIVFTIKILFRIPNAIEECGYDKEYDSNCRHGLCLKELENMASKMKALFLKALINKTYRRRVISSIGYYAV